MAGNFFDEIDLQHNLEISNALSLALGVPVAGLIGRKFFYNEAAKAIYLFEDGKYRYAASLPVQPGEPNPSPSPSPGYVLTPEQLAALAKAHDSNTDIALAYGTPNQVTAQELRAFLDEPIVAPPPTPGGSDANLIYTNNNGPITTISIPHALNKVPSVTVFDGNGVERHPAKSFPNLATVVLTFTPPIAGFTASLN